MQVHVRLGAPGAEAAAAQGDVTLVIDALRASVTIAMALHLGAREVRVAGEVEEARLLANSPHVLVAGERDGVKVPGFDFGNSPTELQRNADRLLGRTLVLTTSNGTRCVRAALGSRAILAGALPNATAVAQAAWSLAQTYGADITLLAAGVNDEPTPEDAYAAAAIAVRLAQLGAQVTVPPPQEDAHDLFTRSPNGLKLANLGYADDVALCARLDLLSVVPILGGEGFIPLRRTAFSAG